MSLLLLWLSLVAAGLPDDSPPSPSQDPVDCGTIGPALVPPGGQIPEQTRRRTSQTLIEDGSAPSSLDSRALPRAAIRFRSKAGDARQRIRQPLPKGCKALDVEASVLARLVRAP